MESKCIFQEAATKPPLTKKKSRYRAKASHHLEQRDLISIGVPDKVLLRNSSNEQKNGTFYFLYLTACRMKII